MEHKLKKKKFNYKKIACFLLVLVLAIVWITPLIWAILTSFKSEVEVQTTGFSILPAKWVVENYIDVLSDTTVTPIIKWFGNSLFVSVTHTILAVIISSMAAYAYSRLNFKGKNTIFGFLLMTMMFPAVVNLIPLYKIMDTLNWVNTSWALIFPGLGGVVNIFLIRQFMMGIPKEYDESARVDGASTWRIYTKIIVPLCKPILIIVGLFSFTGSWNDFLWPTIIMNDTAKLTLTAGLRTLQTGYSIKVAHLMAVTVLAILPTLILYLVAQKYFMEGLSLQSGVKG
ncbi:carbohydrate ABC transporter permease [Clostridium tertium]|jgi:multiple sugar transport system permease protein|uniref:carbohydrate ABC transporter permease n=1 Tax=Clostridium TaxID=1485 RepID=UPI000DD0171B|nr:MULTISPECIES: carbohydrate ABC transporter permease [Clostridium]MBP1867532.1 multiple sugar transport system permease protein [Clostridium tertium]MBS5306629.1 carbohydrate ABC transporter permease [Clostridium sp.]MBS6500465.1 carbohydrate ABC transporter permease [Clostridium sp.]MDB1922438.1 carbohydrate ABC transporter permease [Clostridium tertium]MDB1926101.1 carbohydrate ABC transporter permease [Clostridium tertium]